MFDKKIDAYMIHSPANRCYFTGIDTSFGVGLITESEKIFFTDFRYESYARKTLADFTVIIVKPSELYAQIEKELKRLDVKTVGYEDAFITVGAFKTVKAALADFTLKPASAILDERRMVKTEAEIEKIQNAQRIAEKALTRVIPFIKPGVTEREISAELTFEMIRLGADTVAFDNIVSFGENSANPHHHPSDKKLDKNELILIDFGARAGGYYAYVYARQSARRVENHSRHCFGSTILRAQIYQSRHDVYGSRLVGARIHTCQRLRQRIRPFARTRRGHRDPRGTALRRACGNGSRSRHGGNGGTGHLYRRTRRRSNRGYGGDSGRRRTQFDKFQ